LRLDDPAALKLPLDHRLALGGIVLNGNAHSQITRDARVALRR
jgi:hypothetical protein